MRKLLILFFILSVNFLSAQVNVTPKYDGSVPTATTAFGVNIAVGMKIYEVDTKQLFVCTAASASTLTLTTGAANFRDLGDYNKLENLPTTFSLGNPSNTSCSGLIIVLEAVTTTSIGDVGYLNSSGSFVLCKADAIADCPYCFCMCGQASVSTSATGNFITTGIVRYDSWSWTIGGLIYVSTTGTTGNTLTQTPPSDE